jgi:hypothetical protein
MNHEIAIPIKTLIKRRQDGPESFETNTGVLAVEKPPTYEVEAMLLIPAREEVRTYTFHSMVDVAKPPTHSIGEVQVTSIEAHREYLEQLRNSIDELLGDVERDGDRTKIYGEVVDENRDERGHYAVIKPSVLP